MRSETSLRTAVTALVALLVLPLAARAGEDDARLRALEQRLLALEDKLDASEQVIESQRELLGRQAPATGAPAVSQGEGLDSFLSGLDIGGFVTASYAYNFNNPDVNNFSQVLCQFNCDHNEFTLDAAKLELGKEAASPGQAGFQIDLLFGQNATIFESLSFDRVPSGPFDPNDPNSFSASSFASAGDLDLYLQEAYVSYNFRDIVVKMGKFETLLGWELIDSHLNYNVSHGILFTWAIPLVHTGVLASGSVGESIGWAVGATNGFNNFLDDGDNKGVLGQLSFSQGPFFASASTYIGTPGGFFRTNRAGNVIEDDETMAQIYDFVLQFTPNERLDTWVNVDWGKTSFSDEFLLANPGTKSEATWAGVAGGFNFNLTEKLNFAMRGEWFLDDNNSRFGWGDPLGTFAAVEDTTAVSATATLGYRLTDNLLARLEVRHDVIDTDPDTAQFPNADRMIPSEDEATYGIVEVSYVFD